MASGSSEEWHSEDKDWLSTVSVGFFRVSGRYLVSHADLFSEVIDFVTDFHLEHVGAGGETGWFGFIAELITFIGLLIIVSSLVKLLFKRV